MAERLIDEDYMIRDISIPNLNDTKNLAAFETDVDKYQKEVLKEALGFELYSLFIADPSSEQRFIDIRDGKPFSFDLNGKTVTREYVGLQNDELESLIAYYVYFNTVSNRATYTSGIGEVLPQGENSVRVSPNQKLMRAWNNFVDLTGFLAYDNRYCGKYFNKLDLSSYSFLNDAGSLYNFLLANKDVYPEWEFAPTDKIYLFNI
jgi:hypothetical protein